MAEKEKKTLNLKSPGKLTLGKSGDASKKMGQTAHTRSGAIAVEVKKKRGIKRPISQSDKSGFSQEAIENSEKAARLSALQDARLEDERKSKAALLEAEEDAKIAAVEEKKQVEEPKKEMSLRELEALEMQKISADANAQKKEKKDEAAQAAQAEKSDKKVYEEESDARNNVRAVRSFTSHEPPKPEKKPHAPKNVKRSSERRSSGKLTVSQALSDAPNAAERYRSLAAVKRARQKERRQRENVEVQKVYRDVQLPEFITVQELANRMSERAADVIKSLMKLGVMATVNQSIDADTAEIVISEMGHKVVRVSESDVEDQLKAIFDDKEDKKDLVSRPPVVTIMGHVDHGKTSLLDALRETDVVDHESGGITQHIGAYQVVTKSGDRVSFIDTPGHAAFSQMRARGANVTDIVILVVAADDSIKPQTIEAINHAKAACVPIIVAINKCDLEAADPQKVKTDLLQHEVVVEDMSGDVVCVEVSAKSKIGLDKLVDMILLQSELLELKANPKGACKGAVIEAKIDKGKGVVATVLIQNGTLKVGDIFVAGNQWGKVKALSNERGQTLKEAGPSIPVEILGANSAPLAGDELHVVENEYQAREITEYRIRNEKNKAEASRTKISLDNVFNKIKEGEMQELAVVIKADVQGSVEAIVQSLEKITADNTEIKVRILHGSVGPINESDVTLAQAANAMIIGFNVRANPQAKQLSNKEKIDIRYYSIIYNVIDEVKLALEGMLSPELKETFIGYATIREVFNITKVGKIAGCMVTQGIVKRGAGVRLLREDVVIHEGKLKTLKRFKEEVKEVKEGYECGMAFENYDDIREKDVIEVFEIIEEKREL